MGKQNREKFDSYSEDSYFKTNEKAEKVFKELSQFPNALGYDTITTGFIVLHKKHKASGIQEEVESCLIFKIRGFDIELIEEYENEKSCDVKIEGKIFEIKTLKNADNINRAISRHFQRSYTKTSNIILYIKQKVAEHLVKSSLKEASETYPSIKRVWLIYKGAMSQLDRKMMLSKSYTL